MNDLPVTTAPSDQTVGPQDDKQPQEPITISPGGKEAGSFSLDSKEFPLSPVGHEVELSKEVQSAGVKVHPATVPLSQTVSDQGVQSVGHNVPPQPTSGSTITLPLTDEQIEKGLKENVSLSIRWLAEWCTFQLKKVHNALLIKHT